MHSAEVCSYYQYTNNSTYIRIRTTNEYGSNKEFFTDLKIQIGVQQDFKVTVDPQGYLYIFKTTDATLHIYDLFSLQPGSNVKPLATLVAKKSDIYKDRKCRVFDFAGFKIASPDPKIVAFVKPTPPKSLAARILLTSLKVLAAVGVVAAATFAAYSLAPATFTAVVLNIKSAATLSNLFSVAKLASKVVGYTFIMVGMMASYGEAFDTRPYAKLSVRIQAFAWSLFKFAAAVACVAIVAHTLAPAIFAGYITQAKINIDSTALIVGSLSLVAVGALGIVHLAQKIWSHTFRRY